MSWVVEGFKNCDIEEPGCKVFSAEAQYLADVFLAVRDASSVGCDFISIVKKK